MCCLQGGGKSLKVWILRNSLYGTILHCANIAKIFEYTALDKKYCIINHEHEFLA